MDLIIRSMEAHEAREVGKLAKRSFPFIEGITVGVKGSDTALVAVSEGKIVGAFIYKFKTVSGKKFGYVSFLFTDPDMHGRGIAKRLCEDGVRLLWDAGCDALVTFVRDDNVASWRNFEKHNFVRADFFKLSRFVGAGGAAKLYFSTMFAVALGNEFYISVKEGESSFAKEGSAGQISAYAMANILLALPIIWSSNAAALIFLALIFVMSGIIISGYIGTLLSKRNWRFRLVNGGGLICAIVVALGGYLPMVGSWYPSHYENTREFRRDMAATSVASWVFLLGIYAYATFVDSSAFMSACAQISTVWLVARCVPVEPFGPFGGARVLGWNKTVFGLLAAASLMLVFVI